MKPNRKPKHARVIDTFQNTPNMHRIILQSDDFKQLNQSDRGGYIKLMFHPEGHTDISNLGECVRPVMRTYTINELDTDAGKVSVDFVIHELEHASTRNLEQGGYAIHWAMNAKVGDEIFIGGPGNSQDIDFESEQVILVADMTAIPAMSAKVALLDENATGHVVVQLHDEADKPELALPNGVRLHTVIGHEPQQLADAVAQLDLISQDIAIWCACEFSAMKAIRTHFKEQNLIQREKSYFSSYWKQGVTEDGHKVLKREDAESLQSA
ncbi:siderophore-interacting protein [Vibrio gangliei]|uniref:siderophore-interacting protein n=1 Tax=Vibrio gangliei TaxID=2077090 RepID=UPI000D012EBA|nr:siderophore-interacting protein [Vibrio gangliei]